MGSEMCIRDRLRIRACSPRPLFVSIFLSGCSRTLDSGPDYPKKSQGQLEEERAHKIPPGCFGRVQPDYEVHSGCLHGIVVTIRCRGVLPAAKSPDPRAVQRDDKGMRRNWFSVFLGGEGVPPQNDATRFSRLLLFRVRLVFVFVPVGGRELPCLLYTSPSPRDGLLSRMPSSA